MNERGVVLILTMGLVLLMLALGLAIAMRAQQEAVSVKHEYERMVAFNLADGAIDMGRAIVLESPEQLSNMPAIINERLNFTWPDPGGDKRRIVLIHSVLTLVPGHRAVLEVVAQYPVYTPPRGTPARARLRLRFYPIDKEHPEMGLRADNWEQVE